MSLYNLRSADGDWRITKFDNDLNPESSYFVSHDACECPAGHRPSCRHRQMLPRMLAAQADDSPMFYDFDNDRWLAPTGTPEIIDVESMADEQTFDATFVDEPYGKTPHISSGALDETKADNAEAKANLRQSLSHPQGTIRRRL